MDSLFKVIFLNRAYRILLSCLCSALLLLTVTTIVLAANETRSDNDYSINLPGEPQDITWDGQHLRVLDGKAKKVYSIDTVSGDVVRTISITVDKPVGLAFDGELLWIADERSGLFHAIDPHRGKSVKQIKMRIPQDKGFKSLEGITWDGRNLWVAYYAGFSSSFNRIDTESGQITKSVYSDCYPRGIASDGNYLWSICYNGEKYPPKIDGRRILDKEYEMLDTREFIKDIEGRTPVGLVYDGEFLWYADRKLKKAFKFSPKMKKKQ